MGKLALVFSGQGSHYVGMGLDYPSPLLERASHILEYDVTSVLNDEFKLNQTLYAQPLIVLKSILGFEAIQSYMAFDGVCGFSLGEYSAYYASGIFDFETLLNIVLKRSILMQKASLLNHGSMAAVIGLAEEEVEEVCQSFNHQVVIANYNSPQQFVISGPNEFIDLAIEQLKDKARRIIRLNVSGAFHSSLMDAACAPYQAFIEPIKANQPKVTIYMNQTAKPLKFDELKQRMVQQITHAVQWIKTIKQMKKDGYTHFLEIGPGKTLSSFIKKIDRTLEVMSFDRYDQIDDVKRWLEKNGFQK